MGECSMWKKLIARWLRERGISADLAADIAERANPTLATRWAEEIVSMEIEDEEAAKGADE